MRGGHRRLGKPGAGQVEKRSDLTLIDKRDQSPWELSGASVDPSGSSRRPWRSTSGEDHGTQRPARPHEELHHTPNRKGRREPADEIPDRSHRRHQAREDKRRR